MNKQEFKKAYSEARKKLSRACRANLDHVDECFKEAFSSPAMKSALSRPYDSDMWHNIHFKGNHSPRIAMQCNLLSRSRNLSPSRNGFGPSSQQFCHCGVKP